MTKIRPGLCSVTFRALSAEQVVELAADARLEVIEWGADVHVPAGDVEQAARVAKLTTDAGLASCSYGSYFRAGAQESITPVLDAAAALGVDRMRIWAGESGSDESAPQDRASTVARLQDAVDEASARSISLAVEFHSGTLADTAPATLRVLEEVARPTLSTYWQPTVGAGVDAVLDEYRAVADHVSAAHVFSWWPARDRLPLRARDALWTRFFGEAQSATTPPRHALLEFVPGDDPAMLRGEAATLRSYLSL